MIRGSVFLAMSMIKSAGAFSIARQSSGSCFTRTRQQFARLYFSSSNQITQIDREQMEEILEDIANAGREETGYVVIDVRNPDEIAVTGNLSPHVLNLPLPLIMQRGALQYDEEEFEDLYGFAKPSMDETLVFTCKAGIRSMYAAQIAASLGYENIANYRGGSDEWFSNRF